MTSAIPINGETWIICGGRDFTDAEMFDNAMTDLIGLRGVPLRVSHGGANGADTLAQHWAERMAISCRTFMAKWGEHGKSAGPIRNQEMIDTKPHFVVAFPGGSGTADMVSRARKDGVPVAEIKAVSPPRKRCIECGKNWADPPSKLCPGCDAYREHQA